MYSCRTHLTSFVQTERADSRFLGRDAPGSGDAPHNGPRRRASDREAARSRRRRRDVPSSSRRDDVGVADARARAGGRSPREPAVRQRGAPRRIPRRVRVGARRRARPAVAARGARDALRGRAVREARVSTRADALPTRGRARARRGRRDLGRSSRRRRRRGGERDGDGSVHAGGVRGAEDAGAAGRGGVRRARDAELRRGRESDHASRVARRIRRRRRRGRAQV